MSRCTITTNNKEGETTMFATISDVALYILGEIGRQSVTDIQWYCYFAQAKSFEKYGNPIFEEDFFATEDGPVCLEFAERYEERPSISAYNIQDGHVARLTDYRRQRRKLPLVTVCR